MSQNVPQRMPAPASHGVLADIKARLSDPRHSLRAALKGRNDSEKVLGDLGTYLRKCESDPYNRLLTDLTPQKTVALFGAIANGISSGLSFHPAAAHLALVPYQGKNGVWTVDTQVMYKGLLELARRSERLKGEPRVGIVQERDFFAFAFHPAMIEHRPSDNWMDRGPVIAYYAVAYLKDDPAPYFAVLPRHKAEEHRDRYSKAKSDFSPWVTAFDEMALKTVLKMLLKRLPMSLEVASVLMNEDESERIIEAELVKTAPVELVKTKRLEKSDRVAQAHRAQPEVVDVEFDSGSAPRNEGAAPTPSSPAAPSPYYDDSEGGEPPYVAQEPPRPQPAAPTRLYRGIGPNGATFSIPTSAAALSANGEDGWAVEESADGGRTWVELYAANPKPPRKPAKKKDFLGQ